MATTFDVFYLGTGPEIDLTEGNGSSENASALVGFTFGGAGDALANYVETFSPGSSGFGSGDPNRYDTDNTTSSDTFKINGGADHTVDGLAVYSATITYVDGSTAVITAVVMQDTSGNLYLVPETSFNSDQAALEASPIESVSLDSVAWSNTSLEANRFDADFSPAVDGTDGDDTMGNGYTDEDGDTIGIGDDVILAGDGNDSVIGGDGNDYVEGGAGDDTIGGYGFENGNDEMYGGAGRDSIIGGAGDDTVYGGTGNDDLSGAAGNDTLYGGDDDDLFAITDDHDGDLIFGGEGGVDYDGIAFSEFVASGGVVVTFDGDEQGSYAFNSTTGAGTFEGIEGVYGTGSDDRIDGSADSAGVVLAGNGGDDTVTGGGGRDFLFGGSGADTVSGGAGDDVVEGGTGDDLLTGGAGNDDFNYTVGDGHDIITDFNSGTSGTISDGDNTNNDFIELSSYYDHLSELYADQADDGILNQSNNGVDGVNYFDNTQFGAGSLTFTGASADSTFFTQENTGVVCFTSGTRILTPCGEVVIDDLRVGDLVTTADNGAQRICWIGRRHLRQAALRAAPNLRPVLIRQGVLGTRRDLLVSPQHGMVWVSGDLVRAIHLARLPHAGVRVAHGKREVTYFHLMFEAHQILFAEGAASESFYPGPMAQRMLTRPAQMELSALFPQVVAPQVCRDRIVTSYGGTARAFLGPKRMKKSPVRAVQHPAGPAGSSVERQHDHRLVPSLKAYAVVVHHERHHSGHAHRHHRHSRTAKAFRGPGRDKADPERAGLRQKSGGCHEARRSSGIRRVGGVVSGISNATGAIGKIAASSRDFGAVSSGVITIAKPSVNQDDRVSGI